MIKFNYILYWHGNIQMDINVDKSNQIMDGGKSINQNWKLH
jgi:hypothetical protein